MLGNDPSVKGGISSVITQLQQYNWNDEGIKMKFIPTYKNTNLLITCLFFLRAYFKILFSMLFFRPEIVHIHMSYKGSFFRTYIIHKLCYAFGIRDIIHLHGSEFKQWYDDSNHRTQNRIKKLLRECDKMVVLGSTWKSRVLEIEPKTQIIVVNNTVPIPTKVAQWSNSKFQVLFLGVLIKRKGVDNFIEAISLLSNGVRRGNISFVIAGTGEEEDRLKKKCHDLKLDDIVTFTGWIDGKKRGKLILESHLLVLPSYNEGLPMAVLEAMSFGLPIVATDVGDIQEAVVEGENGYLTTPGESEKLAVAMSKIINAEKVDWERLSNMSHQIAEKKFNDSNYKKIFVHIYKY